jgi:ribosomal protein L11 methyltransferase
MRSAASAVDALLAPERRMTRDGGVWRLRLMAPDTKLAERVAAALGSVCGAVSRFAVADSGAWLVEGFSETPLAGAALDTALALAWIGHGLPPAPVLERLPARDWVRENQESFPPRRIGRYFVYGSHHRGGVPPGAIGLLIDAATAFGTGEHASTAGCLRALDALACRRQFGRVLDLGTGTGILAIAAAKTFARDVLAVDIDGGSVRVARENARRNGVARCVATRWSRGYLGRDVRRGRPYDLVLANILARPLAKMARGLGRALAPGGVAILAGLIEWQSRYVLAAHRARRLSLVTRSVTDGWCTLVVRRRVWRTSDDLEQDHPT